MKKIIIALLFSTVAFSLGGCTCVFGCVDHMSVQRGYVFSRDECQDDAELRMESFAAYQKSQPADPFDMLMTPRQKAKQMAVQAKQQKAMLYNMFKDCMGSKDWVMSKPKDDKPQDSGGGIIDTARKPVNTLATQSAKPTPFRTNVGEVGK